LPYSDKNYNNKIGTLDLETLINSKDKSNSKDNSLYRANSKDNSNSITINCLDLYL
jgi:hypothetical protein